MFPHKSFLPRKSLPTIPFGQNRAFQKFWNSNCYSSRLYEMVSPSFLSTVRCSQKSRKILTPDFVRSSSQIIVENKNSPHCIINTNYHHPNIYSQILYVCIYICLVNIFPPFVHGIIYLKPGLPLVFRYICHTKAWISNSGCIIS